MIDHLSITVADYDKSKQFYTRALAPLGYSVIMEFTKAQIPNLEGKGVCGLGEGGKPDFWMTDGKAPTTPTHLAFSAKNRATVDAFFEAALAAGAKSNGEPGIRAHYHPNYYGAFVIDPNGHNLEAVCHQPE